MKARLGAYAAAQLRDVLGLRALLVLAVTAGVAWGLLRASGIGVASLDPAAGIAGRELVRRAFATALGVYALVGALLSAQGLVARDRWRGFDRVLFARPMPPVRYYVQGFLVAGVATIGLGTVLAGAFATLVQPVSVAGVAAYVALTWLAIGAMAFALSAVTSYYLPVTLVLVGAAFALDRYAESLRAAAADTTLTDAAKFVLPPAAYLASLRETFSGGAVTDIVSLAWPLAFGIVWLAAAALLLFRRPFRS